MPNTGVRFAAHETHDSVEVSVSEPGTLWPPDVLEIRLRQKVWRFDPDANTFESGSPCKFSETKTLRRWSCALPIDRSTPQVLTVAARRRPAGDETDDEEEREANFVRPVVLGAFTPEFSVAPKLVCASQDGVKLKIDGHDPVGLDRVELTLVGGRGNGLRGRFRDGFLLSKTLQGLKLNSPCIASATDPKCNAVPGQKSTNQIIKLPLTPAHFAHVDFAEDITPGKPDADALAEAYRSLGGTDEAPRDAFIAARICNVAGRCQQRFVTTQPAYRALLEIGCEG